MRAHCTHVRVSLLHAASHKPFLTANVVGVDARLTAHENWACEAALEVAHVGVLNEAEPSLQWRHVLAPFAPHASAWSIGEPMVLVAVQKHASHAGGGGDGGIGTAASPIVLSHIGVKLYPLKAHVTYDLIMSLVAFAAPFTDEDEAQQEEAQSTTERRVAFLPQAGLLSAAEADALQSSSSSASASASSALFHRHRSSAGAFESKVDLRHQTRKSLAAFANRIYDEHRRLLLEDAAASSADSSSADDDGAEAAEGGGGGGAAAKDDAASALLSLVDPVITFVHFRIEAIVVVASYLSGVAGKSHGITDIEGLQIEFPVCLYQRESLKLSEMLWRLKMRLIVELLKQVGGTLGDILGFKFGFDSAMKRRAQGILESSAIQQSVVVADDEDEAAVDNGHGAAAAAVAGNAGIGASSTVSASAPSTSSSASASSSASSVAGIFSLFTASSPVKVTKRSLLLGNSTENRGSPPPTSALLAARIKSPPASSGTPLASVSEFDDEAEAVLQYHFNH